MTMYSGIYTGRFDIPSERDFLGNIREIAESFSVYIVFFDRSAIAGCRHIRAALSLAERSFFEYETPISNFFEMEVLLYAFGTRQTGFASGFGIHRGENDSVILICRRESGKTGESGEASFRNAVKEVIAKISSLEECPEGMIASIGADDCRKLFQDRTEDETAKLAETFQITPEEIEVCGKSRIEELVIERCALLDVNK